MTRLPAGFWVIAALLFLLPMGYGMAWSATPFVSVVAQSGAILVFGLLGLYFAQFVLIVLLDTFVWIPFGMARLLFWVFGRDGAGIDRAQDRFVSGAAVLITRIWSAFLPQMNERDKDA